MDCGRHRRGWGRWTDTRRNRNAQGEIHRLHRGYRQRRDLDCGTLWCTPGLALGASRTAYRTRGGHFLLVACNTPAPASTSKIAFIE